jgi:hypothetical protein
MKPTAIIEREGAAFVSLCPELDIASNQTHRNATANIQLKVVPIP